VFRHVSRIFEPQAVKGPETSVVEDEPLAESIRVAWRSEDAWLRACAVRASRHVTGFDARLFATGGGDSPFVLAELESLSARDATC
jgi:hypothetical protein